MEEELEVLSVIVKSSGDNVLKVAFMDYLGALGKSMQEYCMYLGMVQMMQPVAQEEHWDQSFRVR